MFLPVGGNAPRPLKGAEMKNEKCKMLNEEVNIEPIAALYLLYAFLPRCLDALFSDLVAVTYIEVV